MDKRLLCIDHRAKRDEVFDPPPHTFHNHAPSPEPTPAQGVRFYRSLTNTAKEARP